MIKNKTSLLIAIIFAIAALARFYQLAAYPVSLSIDEVAIGYDAYSVMHTLRDQWGNFLPLAFKSVGDYKPPVNVYLAIPSIAIFGLNEFGVRFPTALLGALTPIVFFFLLRRFKFSPLSAFASSIWLALVPWHIHFSRASFEAVTALFFLLLGCLTYLTWIKNNRLYQLLVSLVCFSLSVWAYHSERLFTPIIFAVFTILFVNLTKLKTSKKQLIIGTCLLAIFIVPFLKLFFFTPAITTRISATSFTNDPVFQSQLKTDPQTWYLFIHQWLFKYLNYFDLRFWFNQGLQFTPPEHLDVGLLYLIDLPLFLFSFYHFLRSPNNQFKKLTLAWFFLGPLPASLTINDQHPLRSLVWLPAFGFIMAYGFEKIIHFRFAKLILPVYYLGLIINIVYFSQIYFYQFPHFYSEYWQYGYKTLAQIACQQKANYQKIILSETFGSYGPLNTGTPHLYFLFYCQYPPAIYQHDHQTVSNVVFRRPSLPNDLTVKNQLLLGSTWDFYYTAIPPSAIIKTLNFANDRPAFMVVDTNLLKHD